MNARQILTVAALSSLYIAAAGAQQPEQPRVPQIIVSQSVADKSLLTKVEPDYPDSVKSKELAGQIVIAFTISKDGDVANAGVVFKDVAGRESVNIDDPELRLAAVAAVKQWKYRPYLLNGEPVEAATSVVLPFDFNRSASSGTPPAARTGVFARPVIDPKRAEELLTHKVEATYPQMARIAHIQGDAVIYVLIDKQGHVAGTKPQKGHPILIQAALDAVKQWEYQPFQLNGEPAEVETTVLIKFRQ
jgi:bla regulator protein blaR1